LFNENTQQHQEFMGTTRGICQNINALSHTRSWHFPIITFENSHEGLKLFHYNIHILQNQTDDNKAERLAFSRDISQGLKTILAC